MRFILASFCPGMVIPRTQAGCRRALQRERKNSWGVSLERIIAPPKKFYLAAFILMNAVIRANSSRFLATRRPVFKTCNSSVEALLVRVPLGCCQCCRCLSELGCLCQTTWCGLKLMGPSSLTPWSSSLKSTVMMLRNKFLWSSGSPRVGAVHQYKHKNTPFLR